MSDDRITTKAPRGQHIKLICAHHPDLGWSTKNIGSCNPDTHVVYAARSIFYFGTTPECSCPANALRLDPSFDDLPEVAP